MNTAQTILEQIKAGHVPGCQSGIHAMMCWGFHRPVNTGNGLSFKVKGAKVCGSVQVEYNAGTDLYDLKFMNIRGRVLSETTDVFCEDLAMVIDCAVESGE